MNLVHKLETREGDGMEVWITLDESEMDILLCDQEFLAFVTVDPNLLQCFSLIGMASLG